VLHKAEVRGLILPAGVVPDSRGLRRLIEEIQIGNLLERLLICVNEGVARKIVCSLLHRGDRTGE